MKKVIIIGSMILLAGITSVKAQSGGNLGGNTGQQGSSPQNYGRKANTSQTTGRGVPYNKDAEQKGSGSTATSRAARQSPGSSGLSSTGTASQKNTSGSASTRQQGSKQGGMLPKNANAGKKSGSGSSSNQ